MAYTFENGRWGNYDDGRSSFADLRERLGFMSSKSFSYALGTATLYSRTNKTVKWPYSFVCSLSVNSHSFYHVWIKDLPSVFQFLREIGASKPENTTTNQDLINYLRDETFLDDALDAIRRRDKDV